MRYYPHMPGNSCSADKVSLNTALQDAFMNKEVVLGARRGSVEEVCAVLSLLDILDHYFAHLAVSESSEEAESVGAKRKLIGEMSCNTSARTPQRIALLKVDVEGDEYEALQSLSCAQWLLVDRVVIESHPVHIDSICALLLKAGFVESCISSEADCTGNTLIFAFRR